MPATLNRVEVTLQGDEIAKWCQRKVGSDPRRFSSDYFALLYGTANVYVDVEEVAGKLITSSVPYLGEDSRISLLIRPSAIGEYAEHDSGQLIIAAICLLQQEGIPVGECERVQVNVERREV